MEGKTLYLKTKDLSKLKEIGNGTDGKVYSYTKNTLIKLYHSKIKEIVSNYSNDEDVKIYKTGQNEFKSNFYKGNLTYYQYDKKTKENIKLLPKDAIKRAIERHDDVKLTSLPIGTVYLNGHFAGCILERKRGIQIHKLTGLPLSLRKKIYLNILKEEAELLKNNIYHLDLSNSPYVKKTFILPNDEIVTTGHSHILVNPITLGTNFIDLEGKSTVYTETKNDKLENQSLSELCILTLEFLLQIDWEELKEEPEAIYPEFEGKQVPFDLQEKIINQEVCLEDLHQLVKVLKR